MLFTHIFAAAALATSVLAYPAEPVEDTYLSTLLGDDKEAGVDIVTDTIINHYANGNGTSDIDARDLDIDARDLDIDARDLERRDSTGRCFGNRTPKSKGIKAHPNGCGPKWASGVPEFTFGKCCNAHDICYSTCSRSKGSCDRGFLKCMVSDCHDRYKPWNPKRWLCDAGAGTYFSAVRSNLGKVAFALANRKHCKCV